jgi:hypothetical protein
MIKQSSHRHFWAVSVLALLLTCVSRVHAAPPDGVTIFKKMKAALEPAKPSTRKLTLTIHSADFGENTQMVVRQARKVFPDGERSVTIVMSPDTLKGVAFLVVEHEGKPHEQYLYLPALRRVRKISGPRSFEPFLNSDFTYADMGLLEIHEKSLKLLGTREHGGTQAYELQEKPRQAWYYSRIVDWIAVDTELPLERDHYDTANALWRKQVYEDVAIVDAVPTPMHMRVDDVQSKDWSDYKVDDLHYDVQIPDEIFDPKKLPDVITNPLWSAK